MISEQLYRALPVEQIPLLVPAGILLSGLCMSAFVIYIVSLWLIFSKAG